MAAATVNAHEFLNLLFGHPSLAGLYLAIWDKQTKQTSAHRLPEIELAAKEAEARAESCDVYFGTCPYTQVVGASRGVGDDAGALVGTWLDVDVRDPDAHKAENIPETREQAFDLIYEMPEPPTVVVSSGYGLQAWWVFPSPFLFSGPEERAEGAKMAAGWVTLANKKASKHGWRLDPVGDLARVLRIPGTWNRKGLAPRPVQVVGKGTSA